MSKHYVWFQEKLSQSDQAVTSLNDAMANLPVEDDDDVTSLEYARERMHNTQEFAHELQKNQPVVTSLSEHAQKLQAAADMKTGEKIRAEVADIEDRWAKLRQSVEDKEQLMQVKNSSIPCLKLNM